MAQANIPIQAIVHCEAGGELKPLRFQYEDDLHKVHTVRIDRITDSRKINFVGIEAMVYICQAQDHMYELKFTINTHKWELIRRIY